MDFKPQIKSCWPLLFAMVSGLLLAISFPPLEIEEAAWIALAPLMLAALKTGRPFRAGFLAGAVFWCLSLFWLTHVTYAGWFLLAMYCALYFGIFALLVRRLFLGWLGCWWRNLLVMIATAILWSGLEWVRSNLFTGFSWNAVAVSQYRNIVMIQLAEWGGVYLISALIVLFNVGVALTVLRYMERSSGRPRRPHTEMAFAMLLVALTFAYGVDRLNSPSVENKRSIRIALIQPNIEQTEKWDDEHFEMIYRRLRELTLNAAPLAELCVWPETAIPDLLRKSTDATILISDIVGTDTGLLIGSMDYESKTGGGFNFYNSSFLIDDEGRFVAKYDKQHLVLFGEYVPFENYIPFMEALTPIEGSFRAGREATVFTCGKQNISLSPLICFEDAFPGLSAAAVRAGARLFINQTNDAWFDPSSGSRQHLAQSIFRCVENRVPMARCANTGATGWIDEFGRIREILVDENGSYRTAGFLMANIELPPQAMQITFNTKHSGIFGKICAAFAVFSILIGLCLPRFNRCPAAVRRIEGVSRRERRRSMQIDQQTNRSI